MASCRFYAVIMTAVLALASAAAGQRDCPAICAGATSAAFSNAVGGPVDCCKHDYNANAVCSWGGTPVSFRRVRTCQDAGKSYTTVARSNSQAPGAQECRCPDALQARPPPQNLPSVQVCRTLRPRANSDVSGADIGCNDKSFCMVCGGLEAVRAECANTPRCVAFTLEPATGCGYLKAASSTVTRGGWTAFVA